MQGETTPNGTTKKVPSPEPKLSNGEAPPSGRKMGRPKTATQTMPLIVSNARSRVTEKVAMSAVASRDLRAYVEWASSKIGIPEDEAMILTLDRALGEFLKKDRLWLEYREQFLDGGRSKEEG
jgi:hypothetical protein